MLCFFFKQKTAYEMRISDWSSDVCSSDLAETLHRPGAAPGLYPVQSVPARPLQLPVLRQPARADFRSCHAALARRPDPLGQRGRRLRALPDRKSVVSGKSVSVRVDPGGRRIIKKQTNKTNYARIEVLLYNHLQTTSYIE